jgi:hypothetical protein
MDPLLVSILGQMFACNARIAAMVAANAVEAANGYIKYEPKHFEAEAEELYRLAEAARNF